MTISIKTSTREAWEEYQKQEALKLIASVLKRIETGKVKVVTSGMYSSGIEKITTFTLDLKDNT